MRSGRLLIKSILMKSLIKKIARSNIYLWEFVVNLEYGIKFYYNEIFKKKTNIKFENIDDLSKNNKKNIIIFMPEFIFSNHANHALNLFRSLSKSKKYNILFVRCFNHFTDCMAKKNNQGVKKKYKKEFCYRCDLNLIKKIPFKKNIIDLDQIPSKNFDQTFKLDENFTSDKIEDFKNFTYQNIEMAKFAFYDYFITNKQNQLNPSKKQLLKLKEIVSNNIKLVNYFDHISSKIDISHIFMIDEYSFQATLRRWAENKNINTFFFQASESKEETLEITNRKSWTKRTIDCIDIWDKYKKLNLSANEISKIYESLILRTKGDGGHIFSTNYKSYFAKNFLDTLGFSNNKQTIGLFTSSNDEERSIAGNMKIFYPNIVQRDAFKNQLEWIEETINWVEKNENLQLIIGIHPRLYKSQVSMEIAPELTELKKRYYNRNYKHNNIKIIWPELNISTYNIFEVIDVAVVAWTSLANELALTGIPVITGLEGNFRITPNFDGIIKVENKDAYFKEIAQKLNLDCNDLKISTIINSIKWYSLISYEHELRVDMQQDTFADLNKILDSKTSILNENFITKEMSANLNTQEKQDKALKTFIAKLVNTFGNNDNETKLIKRLKNLQTQLS